MKILHGILPDGELMGLSSERFLRMRWIFGVLEALAGAFLINFPMNAGMAGAGTLPSMGTIIELSPRTVQSLGIGSHLYGPRHGNHRIHVSGVVALIDDRVSYVTVRSLGVSNQIFGRVRKVYADTGDHVVKGQLLATLFSPDYLEAQQEYLQSIKLASVSGKDPSSQDLSRKIIQAAVMKLVNLGVARPEIDRLRKTGLLARYLKMRADLDGYVLVKNAIAGQTVYSGDRLFTIGNMDWIRVNGHVYQQDMEGVRVGDRMEVRIPESDTRMRGRIIYISPMADPKTRTVLVRGIFKNRHLLLRPGMYVSVHLFVPYKGQHLWVPREAVFLERGHAVLFVERSKGKYEMVRVHAGHSESGMVPVQDHLPPSVRIVDQNGFWLKAQFEKMTSRSSVDP
jgi:Cu(I)/Ag(I) efflux system membrane fusion protein